MVQCPERWLKRRSPTEWGWLLYLFSLFLISLEAPQASWRLTAVQCNNKINLELCSAPFSSYLGLFENQGEVYQKPQIPFSHVLLNRGAMAFLLLCHLVGPGEHDILRWHCLTSVGSGGSRPAPRSVFTCLLTLCLEECLFNFSGGPRTRLQHNISLYIFFESQGLRVGMKFITANLNHCTV